MNCFCYPPQAAEIRKVNKPGENQGRDFFSCRNNKCNLFQWADAPLQSSFIQRQANAMNAGSVKKDAGIVVKIALARFDIGPPHNIWFSVNCPTSPSLMAYYTSIDAKHREYSSSLKIWLFSFVVYADVVSKLQSNDIGAYDVMELPRFLVSGLKKFVVGLPTISGEPILNLESTLLENLMPFQLDGIQFVVKRGGRAFIGDEMGCGKTLQAIGVLQHYQKKWPALVLMPPILLQQWRDELLKFSQELLKDSDIVTMKKTSDKVDGRFKILLVPYSIVDKLVESGKISPQMFGVVIADESHNLKSIGAQRTTAAIPFLQKASVAVCLSGTPATNRPIELFTQLNGLLPNVFTDYDAFGKRYCDPKPSKFGNTMEYKGASNESELKMILNGMVMIRRLKEDVVKSLPNKCRELKYVDPDPLYVPQLKAIQKKSASLDSDLRNGATVDKVKIANEQRILLLEHFKVTGLCKIKAITEELARLVDEARYERAVAESTVSGAAAPLRPPNSAAHIDFNGEFELVGHQPDFHQPHKTFESPEECKALTQSVLDDETVVLEPPSGRVSRTGSISSDEEVEDEFVVAKRTNRTGNSSTVSKKRRLLIHDDEDEELFESIDGNLEQESGNSSDYEWVEDVPDYEFNGDHWTQANISPVKIRRKKYAPPPPPSASSSSKKKSAIARNAFDEMKSAAASKSHASPVPASKSKSSSSNLATPSKAVSVSGLGKKIIVFAHHLDVMNAIEKRLVELEVEYIRIDGGVTGPQRNMLIKKFQEDDITDVALLSVTACGTGLNLTRANVAVFGELYWSPGIVLQAEDRIHRLGQKSDSVRIIYMLGRQTADDIVWDQIQRKHHVLGATVGIADHKTTHGGGMAIGKGAIPKSNRYQGGASSGVGSSSSSSSSAAATGPPVNPYHRDNPYTSNISSSTESSSSSSSSTSYSYAAPPVAAVASAVPIADFFKPRSKSSQDNSSSADLPSAPQSFQYEGSPARSTTALAGSVSVHSTAAPPMASNVPVPVASVVQSSSELTAEQRERAERNRRAALEKLALKKQAEEQQRLLASAAIPSSVVKPVYPSATPVISNFGTPVVAVATAAPSAQAHASILTSSTVAPHSNGGAYGTTTVVAQIKPHDPPRQSVANGHFGGSNPYSSTVVSAASQSVYGSTRVVCPAGPTSANTDPYGTPHVFSTGKGSTISTSIQGMQRAERVFESK